METTVKQRLTQFIDYKKISVRGFENACNVSEGFVRGIRVSITPDKMRKILQRFPELDKVWLMTGEGSMLTGGQSPQQQDDAVEKVELPLIPMSAMAGALTDSDVSFMEYDCEKYVVPIFQGADFLIRVQGDSMVPKYVSGDVVACQKVPLAGIWFQWGKTYIIDTRQGALIKRIEPSDEEGCISLHSENAKYQPFDLPAKEVNGVALVKGIIRVE